MNHSRPSLIRNPLIIAIILFTLGVYSYPALATWANTGSTVSPPILAPDTGFYLFLSKLATLRPGPIVNPYYGVEVPSNATAHLKFRLAFLLFGYLNTLLGGHLWLALFVWNLFWWALLCCIAVWLFARFLPDNSTLVVAAGLAFLMWSNFGLLKPLFMAWSHLPSFTGFGTKGFENIGLAYARPFFPQLPVPLLLVYLGLQISVLRKGENKDNESFRTWLAMALLQFAAFTIFPYTTLMMAGITIVTIVWMIVEWMLVAWMPVARFPSVPWRSLAAYGTICAAVDLLFLRLGTSTHEPAAQASVFRIELAELPHSIGGMWIILALLTLAAALIRGLSPEVRWPLVGLGLTNLSLLLGDVFFSETAISLSHHAGYFVHTTVALLLTFIVSALFARLGATARYSRIALGAVVALFAVNAMLLSAATYRTFLPFNQQQVETVSLLKSIPVTADDLLILHARISDDACEWAPMASSVIASSTTASGVKTSSVKALFCRNASSLLAPSQTQTIQRFRQALYLYFTGMDSGRLQRMMDDPKTTEEQMRLAYFGGIIPFRKEEREAGLSALRTDLIPLLDATGRQDPRVQSFLRPYPRILVIDNRKNPVFNRQRLASYLVIEKEVPSGNLTVLYCSPK